MKELSEITSTRRSRSEAVSDLLEQYGCGPIRFSGHGDALYERHLLFDDVGDPLAAGARERFEAAARLVRHVMSQRWVKTERTYNQLNPKCICYLSMEFLIGRSLANNVTNLLLDPFVHRAAQQRDLDWFGLIEEEPDAGLYIHKEEELDDVEQRYPAGHYVLVDDKPRILAAVKKAWGDRVTTILPRQGQFALAPDAASFPAADLTVERIGDLVDYDLPSLFAGNQQR